MAITRCIYDVDIVQVGTCADVSMVDNANGTITFTGTNTLTFVADPPVSGTFDINTGVITLVLASGATVPLDISACCTSTGGDTVQSLNYDVTTDVLTLTTDLATFTTSIPTTTADRHVETIPTGTTTIDITHGLGTLNPLINLTDNTTNGQILYDTKITLSADGTRLTFAPALLNPVTAIFV